MSASESCLEIQTRPAILVRFCARLTSAIGHAYCRTFHREISMPVNGKYRCWRCLREFELSWTDVYSASTPFRAAMSDCAAGSRFRNRWHNLSTERVERVAPATAAQASE